MTEPTWDNNAIDLLYKRYIFNKDISISQWIDDVVDHICIDKHYAEAYKSMLARREFFPTSAVLTNYKKAGAPLAGCVVLDLAPNIEEIFSKTLPKIMHMQLTGTGVGLDLTSQLPRLFPDHDHRAHPGPVAIMVAIAQAVAGPIKYHGVKPSAFMATLRINHPDICEFITLKQDYRLNNVNISVAIEKDFIDALHHGGLLPFTYDNNQPLTLSVLEQLKEQAHNRSVLPPDLSVTSDGHVYSSSAKRNIGRVFADILYLDSKKILKFMAHIAHSCGDPGLVNLHSINQDNPTHPLYNHHHSTTGVGALLATTPCGEQPLSSNELCHLASLNLSAFVLDGSFSYEAFTRAAKLAVRFMDDVITKSKSGCENIDDIVKLNRKIGIGLMGLADTLAELELPYDSPAALIFIDKLGLEFAQSTKEASHELAKERGHYPNWPRSQHQDGQKRRHATLTTIAPTGHIATLAGCSTGIEPYYLLAYERDAAGIKTQKCTQLEKKLSRIDYSISQWIQDTRRQDANYKFDGTIGGLSETVFAQPDKNNFLRQMKAVFKTAQEISYLSHLMLIKTLQKYIDNGISKTVNIPNNASIDDVYDIFTSSLQFNLKGVTVFRDGCLEKQALFTADNCEACTI